MKYKNLTVIGTSHIAQQSVEDIRHTFEYIKPGIVAVELDAARLHSLLHKGPAQRLKISDIKHIGVTGWLFAALGGYVQKKLGKMVNLTPGSDMLTAIRLAKDYSARVYLIDQDVKRTLQRLSKAFSFREKLRVGGDIFRGIFFRKSEMKRYGLDSFDLTKVPDKKIIKKMMLILKERYPNIYKVLIEERNEFMASKLARLMAKHPETQIVAVIGAGHEDELLEIVKKRKIDVVSS